MVNIRKYDSIINHKRHISKNRIPMSLDQRAAQFAPFAALTGYEEKVTETGRITNQKIEIDEEQINELNYKLNIIGKHLKEQNSVSITYFMPDIKKNGGKYQTISGIIKKIDNTEHVVIFENEIKIPLCDIIEISGKFLDELE